MIVGDLLDLPLLIAVLKEHAVEKIIHTAARLGITATANPYQAVQTNIMGTMNVLEASRLTKVEKVVFTTSASVYSAFAREDASEPLSEDAPTKPWGVYASTKLACENLGGEYSKRYGLNFLSARLGAVYGPWKGPPGSGPARILDPLLKELAKRGEAEIRSWCPEMIYSKDVARGLIMLSEAKNLKHNLYNITSGIIFKSAEEFAAQIQLALPRLKLKVAEQTRIEGVSASQPISNQRAQHDFGFTIDYPLENAAAEYYEWIKRHS